MVSVLAPDSHPSLTRISCAAHTPDTSAPSSTLATPRHARRRSAGDSPAARCAAAGVHLAPAGTTHRRRAPALTLVWGRLGPSPTALHVTSRARSEPGRE